MLDDFLASESGLSRLWSTAMLASLDARLRLAKTGAEVPVSNLRGDVGEALTAWAIGLAIG